MFHQINNEIKYLKLSISANFVSEKVLSGEIGSKQRREPVELKISCVNDGSWDAEQRLTI